VFKLLLLRLPSAIMPQSSVARQKILGDNIALMNRLEGFDVVIVCCSGEKQADYWQQRLSAVR
jgi:hypothetical protein